jgi:truncated hemoglobin YjbI
MTMDEVGMAEPLRSYLDTRFQDLASHMRNTETVPPAP